MNKGGKIVTPIREAVSMSDCDGVIFGCNDRKHAEQTRISACVANERNGFEFKTHRTGNDIIVYKPWVDLYADDRPPRLIRVDLR